jgi:hypothetical protein
MPNKFRVLALAVFTFAFACAFIPSLMAGDKSMARKSDALAFNLQIVNL